MPGKGLVLLALCALVGAPARAADLPIGPPPAALAAAPPAIAGAAPPAVGGPPPLPGAPPPESERFRPGAVWGHAGVAWGLVPGLGQLGAAGYGYYGVRHCWAYQPVFDRNGDYGGEQPVNVCVN
jgi:hypothetical protein